MVLLENGRVCRITKGRSAAEFCVIVGEAKDSKCEVVGLNAKKTAVSISHLEPTPTVLSIKKSDSAESVVKALEKAGVKTSI